MTFASQISVVVVVVVAVLAEIVAAHTGQFVNYGHNHGCNTLLGRGVKCFYVAHVLRGEEMIYDVDSVNFRSPGLPPGFDSHSINCRVLIMDCLLEQPAAAFCN